MGGESDGASLLVLGVAPDRHGVGVAQRAARSLLALASAGPVHVLWFGAGKSQRVVPAELHAAAASWSDLAGGVQSSDLGRWLRRIYLRVPAAAPPAQPVARWLGQSLAFEGAARPLTTVPAQLAGRRFRVVHGFRLTSAPALLGLRGAADLLSIDVDDLESDTLRDIARLAEREGDRGFAWLMGEQGRAAARFEDRWLAQVDRIGCCSEPDAALLRERFSQAKVGVLPNAIDSSGASVSRLLPSRAALRLLVVGALGYYPNIDALRFLVREVLPALRARLERPVELHVVGRGASLSLRLWLARCSGVVFHGALPRLDLIYAQSDIALCAIRAGGGTRIKVLEAFAQRVPLVSTRRGASGLAVEHQRELLFAETSTQFVDAIVDIAHNARVSGMVERAFRFVSVTHSGNNFDRALRALTCQEP